MRILNKRLLHFFLFAFILYPIRNQEVTYYNFSSYLIVFHRYLGQTPGLFPYIYSSKKPQFFCGAKSEKNIFCLRSCEQQKLNEKFWW